jgi:hypothetical protein
MQTWRFGLGRLQVAQASSARMAGAPAGQGRFTLPWLIIPFLEYCCDIAEPC